MTYEQTIEFLFNQLPAYHMIGKAAYKENLDNTNRLDSHFGHPHTKFRSIHVAGTNGKGSVSHMTASVLQDAGYKTGLYTSPHLTDFRERIKVDGEMITKEEVVSFVDENIEIIRFLKPSFFEINVAMAFDHFARKKVDVAVIEVGLGGRLDSTNIINPVLSVITNIGYDHMDLLGDTLEKIAFEKAGIIKKDTPVVISETHAETKEVFISKAKEYGAEITFADQFFQCEFRTGYGIEVERSFKVTGLKNPVSFEGVSVLGGDYQVKNITAVFQIFNILKNKFKVTDENILMGIKNVYYNTGLAGRWQILGRSPLTICDTGHNKDGLKYVLNQIRNIKKTKLHMVVGFVNDKDLSSILPMFPRDAVYYFTKASVPRALDEKILQQKAAGSDLTGESYPDVKSAIRAAREAAESTDLIFIGGSTFVVADALL